MAAKSDRVVYLDILRIIACFLVVMVHISAQNLLELQPSSSQFIIHSSYNTLAFSGVALFFMISGALILNPNRHYSIKSMVFKALHIYVIYFIWKFLYMIFDLIDAGGKLNGAFIKNSIINLFSKTGYYHLWFLPAIAVIYLFVPVIKKSVENDKKLCHYFIVVFFVLSVFASTAFHFDFKFKYTVQDFYNLNDFSLFTGYLGFFVLGHYLNRYAESMNSVIRLVIYILGLVMIPASGFIDSYLSKGIPGSMAMNTPFSLPSFVITLALFLFIQNNTSKKNSKLLGLLSAITLGIYLIHPIFIVLCGKIGLEPGSFTAIISIPVITVLVTLASGLVAFVLSKIPVVNKLVKM